MNAALHMIVLRSDSVRGTILRRRPDTSQLSDVWVPGKPEVMQGDVVLVLRINAEGENGFSFIRMFTVDGFAEGFIKSCYLTLRPTDASVVAIAYVYRGGVSPSRSCWYHVDVNHNSLQGMVNRQPCYASVLITPEMQAFGLKADTASATTRLCKFSD